MLQIEPASRGNYRVWDDAIRQTYFVGPREHASGVYSQMLQSRTKHKNYSLRATTGGYGVFEFATPGQKKFTRANCRYESSNLHRAERIFDAFQRGEI